MRPLIRKYLFPLLQAIARPFFAVLFLRGITNAVILPFPLKIQFYLHKVFGRTFRGRIGEPPAGVWKVRFAGKVIKMPLRKGFFWLDWETALSILGHEHFIKAKYAALITSAQHPTLFLDIGANYGTHSLLFMAHGIPAVSFEPNPACEGYFREACTINGFTPRWNAVALGAAAGEIELMYPEKETWVGTTVEARSKEIEALGTLIHQRVPLQTLDSFADQVDTQRAFIKIDTEGAELEVLRGASAMLSNRHPLVIFECFAGDVRSALFDYLTGFGYTITGMGWMPDAPASPLTRQAFIDSAETDFMGIPPTAHPAA